MTITTLECFYAVAQGNTFLQVSESLHLSQASVSRAIKMLESELGVVLLDRSNRSAQLTAAGSALYNDLQGLLPRLHKMQTKMRTFTKENIINYAMVPYTPFLRFGKLSSDFCSIYQNATVNRINLDIVSEGIAEVQSGNIDFLICRDNSQVYPDVEKQYMLSDRLAVILSKDHPWAEKSEITPDDMVGKKVLVNQMAYDSLVDIERATGRRFDKEYRRLSRIEMLLSVAEENRIAVLFESEIGLFKLSSIVSVPLGVAPFPFVIYYNKNTMNTCKYAFLEMCLKYGVLVKDKRI